MFGCQDTESFRYDVGGNQCRFAVPRRICLSTRICPQVRRFQRVVAHTVPIAFRQDEKGSNNYFNGRRERAAIIRPQKIQQSDTLCRDSGAVKMDARLSLCVRSLQRCLRRLPGTPLDSGKTVFGVVGVCFKKHACECTRGSARIQSGLAKKLQTRYGLPHDACQRGGH